MKRHHTNGLGLYVKIVQKCRLRNKLGTENNYVKLHNGLQFRSRESERSPRRESPR